MRNIKQPTQYKLIIMMTFTKCKNIVTLLMALTIPSLITSCGNETAPDPARSENKLVFELFSSLKNGDSKATLKKVERLRILNPDSIFLANLEKTIQANLIVAKIKNLLDNNELKKAIEHTTEALIENPELTDLKRVKNDLRKIETIEMLVNKSINSEESAELRQSLALLQGKINQHAPNELLRAFISQKQELAAEMAILENRRLSLFDLTLDIDYGYNNKDESCWNDLAQMAVEEPDSPVVRHYMNVMKGVVKPGPFILPKK